MVDLHIGLLAAVASRLPPLLPSSRAPRAVNGAVVRLRAVAARAATVATIVLQPHELQYDADGSALTREFG